MVRLLIRDRKLAVQGRRIVYPGEGPCGCCDTGCCPSVLAQGRTRWGYYGLDADPRACTPDPSIATGVRLTLTALISERLLSENTGFWREATMNSSGSFTIADDDPQSPFFWLQDCNRFQSVIASTLARPNPFVFFWTDSNGNSGQTGDGGFGGGPQSWRVELYPNNVPNNSPGILFFRSQAPAFFWGSNVDLDGRGIVSSSFFLPPPVPGISGSSQSFSATMTRGSGCTLTTTISGQGIRVGNPNVSIGDNQNTYTKSLSLTVLVEGLYRCNGQQSIPGCSDCQDSGTGGLVV